jgi:hypothetical protein
MDFKVNDFYSSHLGCWQVATPTRGFPVNNTRLSWPLSRIIILSATVLILMTACTPSLQVRSDVDPTADFSQFTTFNFFEPMGIEAGYNSPVFGEHYREAISRELGQRMYRSADTPDLLINVTVRADDKVSIRSHATPYMSGAYYNRPGGAYGGSAVGVGISVGSGARYSTEVSVFIDFVDFERHQVVWQGVTVFKASDKVAAQLRDAIYTSVNRVFAEYPYIAGQ